LDTSPIMQGERGGAAKGVHVRVSSIIADSQMFSEPGGLGFDLLSKHEGDLGRFQAANLGDAIMHEHLRPEVVVPSDTFPITQGEHGGAAIGVHVGTSAVIDDSQQVGEPVALGFDLFSKQEGPNSLSQQASPDDTGWVNIPIREKDRDFGLHNQSSSTSSGEFSPGSAGTNVPVKVSKWKRKGGTERARSSFNVSWKFWRQQKMGPVDSHWSFERREWVYEARPLGSKSYS
jgi:hypothetical protein